MVPVEFAVNGTLMRGLALNQNLLRAGATFVREAQTAPLYRLWSIDDTYPAMQRVRTAGASIALEIWSVPAVSLVTILQQEPAGLGIGTLLLSDGSSVLGVLGEAYLCEGRHEITSWGGWRAYIAQAGSRS